MWGSVDASMDGCIYLCESGRVSIYVWMYLSIYLCMCVSMYVSVGKNGVSGSDMDDIM